MGKPNVDPSVKTGQYVEPCDWNRLINTPDVAVIDTRNDYEVGIGTFKGAITQILKLFVNFQSGGPKTNINLKIKKLPCFAPAEFGVKNLVTSY